MPQTCLAGAKARRTEGKWLCVVAAHESANIARIRCERSCVKMRLLRAYDAREKVRCSRVFFSVDPMSYLDIVQQMSLACHY